MQPHEHVATIVTRDIRVLVRDECVRLGWPEEFNAHVLAVVANAALGQRIVHRVFRSS